MRARRPRVTSAVHVHLRCLIEWFIFPDRPPDGATSFLEVVFTLLNQFELCGKVATLLIDPTVC